MGRGWMYAYAADDSLIILGNVAGEVLFEPGCNVFNSQQVC